ncbi:Uncharacterised protein [Mycobacteroides abscessus subsp. abscessus]|nr:Uncharacterised protein [Mycobacteroides abscessus subsp. abscessus]
MPNARFIGAAVAHVHHRGIHRRAMGFEGRPGRAQPRHQSTHAAKYATSRGPSQDLGPDTGPVAALMRPRGLRCVVFDCCHWSAMDSAGETGG